MIICMEAIEIKLIELRKRIAKEGLLNKRPAYYIGKSLSTFAMFLVSITLFLYIKHPLIRILDAIFLAFIYVQFGLIGHDIAHNQVFRSQKICKWIGTLYWNLLLGASMSYWSKKHNSHHAHPNELGKDPDIDLPLIFSHSQKIPSNFILKKIQAYQAYYFFPLISLAYVSVVSASFFHLLEEMKQGAYRSYGEFFLFLIHYGLYFWLVFSSLGLLYAIIFITVHHLAGGLYMGTVFAPNHKGMPIVDKQMTNLSLQQIATSRNIRSNPFIDFWYGGLNYQIEHHLFPTMPRKNLKKARIFVKEFCKKHNINHHETGVLQSFAEILKGLKHLEA